MKVVFQAPGPDTPGFLRRQRQALQFRDKIKAGFDVSAIDAMVDYLLPYVIEPTGEEAREALMDATQAEFEAMLKAVSGGGDAVPLSQDES